MCDNLEVMVRIIAKLLAGCLLIELVGFELACDKQDVHASDAPATVPSSASPATEPATTQISGDIFQGVFHDSPDLPAVREIIANQLKIGLDQVKPDSTLADLQMDDFALAETVMALEEKFGVTLSDEAIDRAADNATGQEFFKHLTVHRLAFVVTEAKKSK